MSAEYSLSPKDVAPDVSAGGDSGTKDGPEPGAQPKRKRRSRRDRRRRARQAAQRAAAQNPAAPATDSDSADAQTDCVNSVDGPKPSDLAARRRRTPDGPQNAAGPARNRRRQNRRTEQNGSNAAAAAPRMRTVRETSAGGLVLSSLDKPFEELSAALIGRVDRRGRMMWSLPKGHIETGETTEQTAIREVAEETGIEGAVVAPLGKIDYWFVSEGRRIHKTVHHYLLRSTGGELSATDYEVSEVAWVPLTDLPRKLTYSDERRLARTAEGVIAELTSDPKRLARSEAECIRTEPNDYEKAAAARNQRRNEPPPPAKPRRRRRRGRRTPPSDG